MEDLLEVEIQKVVGPTAAGAAVLLGNESKSFVVFIGMHEALAIRRELKGERTERPLTHDLMQSVLIGFDLKIRQIVVTRIVENAFCATLILEQKVSEKNGDWVGRRNEVRIDARPSDCLVLALKNRVSIHVTREVFEKVQDVSHLAIGDLPLGEFGVDDLSTEGFESGDATPGELTLGDLSVDNDSGAPGGGFPGGISFDGGDPSPDSDPDRRRRPSAENDTESEGEDDDDGL